MPAGNAQRKSNVSLESQRKRMKLAERRVRIARKWVKEGFSVDERLLDIGWQYRMCKRAYGGGKARCYSRAKALPLIRAGMPGQNS